MRYKTAILSIITILACCALSTVSAKPKPAPIKILADQVEVDKTSSSSTYSGNVELTQGEMKLTATTLKVFTKNNRLQRIEAQGAPAHFSTILEDERPVSGEANSLHYETGTQILKLIGKGKLTQAGNTIENDNIEYNLATSNLKAGGKKSNERVEVILLPANDE